MVIEFARHVAGLADAGSTEFDVDVSQPVIATMEEQLDIVRGEGDLGGTMRLGLYAADLLEGSIVATAYATDQVEERHRHRYEVNNKFRGDLEAAGMVFSGMSPDRELIEFIELPRYTHPYFVGTQAHPELRSRPTRPHPLFSGLIAAALDRQRELRLPVDESGLRRVPAEAGNR
jgi:CTP synthase